MLQFIFVYDLCIRSVFATWLFFKDGYFAYIASFYVSAIVWGGYFLGRFVDLLPIKRWHFSKKRQMRNSFFFHCNIRILKIEIFRLVLLGRWTRIFSLVLSAPWGGGFLSWGRNYITPAVFSPSVIWSDKYWLLKLLIWFCLCTLRKQSRIVRLKWIMAPLKNIRLL